MSQKKPVLIITEEMIASRGACSGAVEKFHQRYPKGVRLTWKAFEKAAKSRGLLNPMDFYRLSGTKEGMAIGKEARQKYRVSAARHQKIINRHEQIMRKLEHVMNKKEEQFRIRRKYLAFVKMASSAKKST